MSESVGWTDIIRKQLNVPRFIFHEWHKSAFRTSGLNFSHQTRGVGYFRHNKPPLRPLAWWSTVKFARLPATSSWLCFHGDFFNPLSHGFSRIPALPAAISSIFSQVIPAIIGFVYSHYEENISVKVSCPFIKSIYLIIYIIKYTNIIKDEELIIKYELHT